MGLARLPNATLVHGTWPTAASPCGTCRRGHSLRPTELGISNANEHIHNHYIKTQQTRHRCSLEGEVVCYTPQVVRDDLHVSVAAPLDQIDQPLVQTSPALSAGRRRHASEMLFCLTSPVVFLVADFFQQPEETWMMTRELRWEPTMPAFYAVRSPPKSVQSPCHLWPLLRTVSRWLPPTTNPATQICRLKVVRQGHRGIRQQLDHRLERFSRLCSIQEGQGRQESYLKKTDN